MKLTEEQKKTAQKELVLTGGKVAQRADYEISSTVTQMIEEGIKKGRLQGIQETVSSIVSVLSESERDNILQRLAEKRPKSLSKQLYENLSKI